MRSGRRWPALSAVFAAFSLALCALIASPAQAQVANASPSAQAVIVAPLILVKVQDLNFAKVAPRPTAGTVTVNPNTGACTVTGAIIHQGTCQFAEFASQGTRRMTVRIQLPATVTLTGPGGATMVVDAMSLGISPDLTLLGGPGNGNGNGNGGGNPRYEIVSNTGIFTFRVGGRLNVGANQAPGVYTGTFVVTVQYQ